jgi:formylglycine-generating enzyme required for sulfatase activity
MRQIMPVFVFLLLWVPDAAAQLPVHRNKIGMTFVQLPHGRFQMGAPRSDHDAESNERPQVELAISKTVCMAITEVTQSQWLKVMKTKPWAHYRGAEADDLPAANMRFAEAIEFCARLSEMEGKRYRLPTEAEWEYACRAGGKTLYSFGESPNRIDEFAWWGANSADRAHAVGLKKPNAFGLYDMLGNLSEFCQFVDLEAPGDPHSGRGTLRPAVKRGNSFKADHETKLRSSFRETFYVQNDANSGFRVLLELSAEPAAEPEPRESVTNSIGMKMIAVKAGSFTRGADRSTDNPGEVADDEMPVRRINIRRNFFIGETEVTQRQWTAIMGSSPWSSDINPRPHLEGSEFPAVFMDWEEATEFCRRLSKRERRVYRLPTEAEWEYSCRGGTDSVYSYGDDSATLSLYAWFSRNSTAELNAVKLRKPNPFGLYDCHGNASEWCSDWYDEKYYDYSPADDPTGPERQSPSRLGHVIRGGCALDEPKWLRSSARLSSLWASTRIGFRVLLEAE